MKIRYLLVLVGLSVGIGVAGTFDVEEEVHQQNQYCQMVKDGAWPDYQQTYNSECR